MPYVRRGSPIAVRVNYRRRLGFGDLASDCATGNAAACKDYYSTVYAKAASVLATQPSPVAQADSAPMDYASAPGCHVVNLAQNRCVLDNGIEVGCNSIIECDPLTGAVHGQNAPLTLASGQINPAITPSKTLAVPTGKATPSVLNPFAGQSNSPAPKVVTTNSPAASSNAPDHGTAVPVISALIDQVKGAVPSGGWFSSIPSWALVALGLGGTVLVARSFAR